MYVSLTVSFVPLLTYPSEKKGFSSIVLEDYFVYRFSYRYIYIKEDLSALETQV